jgi:hypothetical protein
MTQDEENVTTMAETTRDYLNLNSAIWNGKPALVTAVNEVNGEISAIRAEAAKQEAPTEGIADEKANLRIALEDLTLDIGSQVEALGHALVDPDLVAKGHVTRSSLDGAQDDDLEQVARRVHQAATDNLAALADYEITAANLTDLDAAITAFSGKKTAPRTAIAARSGSTTTIAARVRNARSILRRRVDRLMVPYRRTQPSFYAGYLAARVIVNRTATQTPDAGTPPPPAGP